VVKLDKIGLEYNYNFLIIRDNIEVALNPLCRKDGRLLC